MTTGAQFTNITNKRIMGLSDFKDNFLDYLRTHAADAFTKPFPLEGTFTDIDITADGNDKFKLDTDEEATDGQGHILETSAALTSGIQFQNTSAVDYYVALRYTERPKGVTINPRNGLPEYQKWEETIGERDEPNSVTDGGTTLTLIVDSVCESGVSHAGRKCLVWLKNAAKNATTEGLAVEELTVAWDSSNNKITTSTVLEQTTVSTTASDYQVLLLGPTVRRNTDLRTVNDVAFIGIVTGAGAGNPPTTFDMSDQNIMDVNLAQFNDIVRIATNGHMKVEVKAFAGESGEDQIRVKDSGGGTVFSVDEVGNVVIEGDLDVTGETTQEDLVQVNSSETITDNLTAGDAAGDNHAIKGNWSHTDAAGTTDFFAVDGTTGQIETQSVRPVVNLTRFLGGSSNRWRQGYFGDEGIVVADSGNEYRLENLASPFGPAVIFADDGGGRDLIYYHQGTDFWSFAINDSTEFRVDANGIRSRDGLVVGSITTVPTTGSGQISGGLDVGFLTSTPINDQVRIGDVQFKLHWVSATEQRINFKTSPNLSYLKYDRTAERFVFHAGGVDEATIDTNGLRIRDSDFGLEYISSTDVRIQLDKTANDYIKYNRTPNELSVVIGNTEISRWSATELAIAPATHDFALDGSGASPIIRWDTGDVLLYNKINDLLALQIAGGNIMIWSDSRKMVSVGYTDQRIGLEFYDSTEQGDLTAIAGTAVLYAKSPGGGACTLWVDDEAGGSSQISPHDPETGEWYFRDINRKRGEQRIVRLERLVEAVEEHLGVSFTEITDVENN